MVLKRRGMNEQEGWMFENDVKTYGTETPRILPAIPGRFENDVKTYGTETFLLAH